jgi:hypothetical protein
MSLFKDWLCTWRFNHAKHENERSAALLELAKLRPERAYPHLLQALASEGLRVELFRRIIDALAGYGSQEPLVPIIRAWVKLKSYTGDAAIPLKDILPVLSRIDPDWKRNPGLQVLTPEILAVAKGNSEGRISHAIELLLVLRLTDLASLYKLADEAGAERGLAVFRAVVNAYVQFGYGKAIPELVKLFWKFHARKVGKNQAFGTSLAFVLQAIAQLAKTENAAVILARDIEGALFEEEKWTLAVLDAFGLRRKAHDLMLAIHKEFKEPSSWPAEGWVAETIRNIGGNPVETVLEAQKLIGRTPNIADETRERVLNGIGFLLQGILKYTTGEARLAAIKAFISACPISPKLVEQARKLGAASSQATQLVGKGKMLYSVLRSQALGADQLAASYCLAELMRLKDLLVEPPFKCWDDQVNAAVEKYKSSL